MIQYIYYHTGRQYVSKLSLDKSQDGYYDKERLFEKLRSETGGNTFTYAPIGDAEAVFMQSSEEGSKGLFVKSQRFNPDLLRVAPCEYIDKYEKSVLQTDAQAEVLPEGRLPDVGASGQYDNFSLPANLHNIFPELVDAVLFGEANKKIVILAENRDFAINYLKVLSLILPLPYMKRIGFCLGVSKISDRKISIFKNDGNEETLAIRIWMPQASNNNYNSLASYCYVFDTITNRNNYTRELSAVAKLLNEINLNKTQLAKFHKYVDGAFDFNGGVNVSLLNQYATLCLFDIRRDADTAKAIISLGCGGGEMQERAFVQASQILLDPKNSQNFKDGMEAFDFATEALKSVAALHAYRISEIKELVKTVALFFDNSKNSRLSSVEEYFDHILKYDDDNLCRLMTAALVASAYKQSTSEAYCELRLRGFGKVLRGVSNDHLKQLDFILAVRDIIIGISGDPELKIDRRFNFLFNNNYGKSLAMGFVRELNMGESLSADMMLRSNVNESRYESMAKAVRDNLLNVNYVKQYIQSGAELTPRYCEFYASLSERERISTPEIEKLIVEVFQETKTNDRLAEYRYNFAYNCYETLSKENKRRIQNGENPVRRFNEVNSADEKLRVVESTIQVFGTNKRIKKKGVLSYNGIILWAFAFSLLSFVILCLPSVVLPAVLGTFSFAAVSERFLSYFNLYVVALPVYVFLLELVAYMALKKGNRVKRANTITFLCGMLPILIFVLSCLLFYFVRIELPFGL